MQRQEVLVACLAAAPRPLSPVQVQKALFLLDKNAAPLTDGPHFAFEPYDYGPFDRRIYTDLSNLSAEGVVEIRGGELSKSRRYGLTQEGQERGNAILEQMAPQLREYFKGVATWVSGLSFTQLVSAIYKAYPEMKVNSVFTE